MSPRLDQHRITPFAEFLVSSEIPRLVLSITCLCFDGAFITALAA